MENASGWRSGEQGSILAVIATVGKHARSIQGVGIKHSAELMFFSCLPITAGPHPVDLGGGPLGSTFYAPNVLNNDPHGVCVCVCVCACMHAAVRAIVCRGRAHSEWPDMWT
eukprot:1146063-Pelagomonas_calceolata.AAC.13